MQSRQENSNLPQQLATGLGWFSIGLGAAELLAPGGVARFIGIDDDDRNCNILRAYGVREIAAGVGILTVAQPAGWLWGRVGGDLLDLGSLARAMASSSTDRSRASAAAGAVLGVTALDAFCAQQLSRNNGASFPNDGRVTKSIVINRSPEEVYAYWRNLENLPNFMHNLESVRTTGDRRSHWKTKGPAGTSIEWEAEIVDDRPNEHLSWRSVEGSSVDTSGTVRFEPGPDGKGTILRVEMLYTPPGGALTTGLAKLFGKDAEQQIAQDLRAFKQIMETGEIVHSDSSIHATMHPARPSA